METSPIKKSYVFFNCDEAKSPKSMNPRYNHMAYRAGRTGRRALWDKVKEESNANRIQIRKEDRTKLREAIISGDPETASDYMKYGCIVAVKEIG